MVKKCLLSLTCAAPLLLAPYAAVAATTPNKAAPARVQQASVAKTEAARPKAKSPAARKKPARSKERIYTVTPNMLASLEAKQAATPSASRVQVASQSEDPFVGFSPMDNSLVGVGLWRVPKADSLDPNRSQPMRDRNGKTGKAAAVGMQINF